jgi:hypothetical protein
VQKKRLKNKRDPRSNKVSIFTGTYDYSDPDVFIKAFYAVKEQTWRDWEWIIFDNSTGDLMWCLLTELEKEDERIKIFTYEREGVDNEYVISPTRSNITGFTKALCKKAQVTGKIVFELKDEDILAEDALDLIVKGHKFEV